MMCEILRAEVGTVVGIINDFSDLQVYKPQIQRISQLEGAHIDHQSPVPGPALGQPQESHTKTCTHSMDEHNVKKQHQKIPVLCAQIR